LQLTNISRKGPINKHLRMRWS